MRAGTGTTTKWKEIRSGTIKILIFKRPFNHKPDIFRLIKS